MTSSLRIAVCGKGGVGKTTVSALLARRLARDRDHRALLVDADHAGGLAVALDLAPAETLEQVRLNALADLQARTGSAGVDLAAGVDYLLLAALAERENLAFLALGRPEQDGCFCAVNSVLKHALERLAEPFDVTLIDAEAGLEQINRDVLGVVDLLLLVADPTVKALRVAAQAAQVAERLGAARRVGLVLNRVREDARRAPEGLGHAVTLARTLERAGPAAAALPLLGTLPEDPMVRQYDAEGLSFFDLPDCPASLALDALLDPLLSPREQVPT